MNKTMTAGLLFLILFLMPFVDYSCDRKPNPAYAPKTHEGLKFIYEEKVGYTVGFPAAFIKIRINPFKIENIYLIGFVDFIFIFSILFGYKLLKEKKIKMPSILSAGMRWLSYYIAAHFLYNLYLPIAYAYWGMSPPFFTQALIFPYFSICEKLGVNSIIPTDFPVQIRISFLISCLLYFLLGTLYYKIKISLTCGTKTHYT